MLPASPMPKTKRDWDEFYTQRSIADNIVKFYAKALYEGLKFEPEKIAAFKEAVRKAYLQLVEAEKKEGGE